MALMATAQLKNGGLMQFWVIRDSQLLSRWKTSDDPSAGWTPLVVFNPTTPGPVDGITAGVLSDGRVQLFATQSSQVYTIWKATTDENAAWVSSNGEAWQLWPDS